MDLAKAIFYTVHEVMFYKKSTGPQTRFFKCTVGVLLILSNLVASMPLYDEAVESVSASEHCIAALSFNAFPGSCLN